MRRKRERERERDKERERERLDWIGLESGPCYDTITVRYKEAVRGQCHKICKERQCTRSR